MLPPLMFFTIIVMLISTLYKITLPANNIFFGSVDEFTKMIIIDLFALSLIAIHIMLFYLLDNTLSNPLFQAVPFIREKVIKYSIFYMSAYYFWFIFIVGFSKPTLLIFFIILNLFLSSIMITLIFLGRISVYRSGKYLLLKLLFPLSFVGIFFTVKYPKDYEIAVNIFQAGIFSIIAYQMLNFAKNYISFNIKDSSDTGIEYLISSIESFFEKLPDNIVRKKIENSIKSRNKYMSLFDITLFRVNHWVIYLLYPWIAVMFFSVIIDHEGMIPFISIIPMLAGSAIATVLSNKDKINFLYVASRLSRKEFINTVLFTVLRKYFIGYSPILPFLLLYAVIYNSFFGTLSYIKPTVIFFIVGLGLIFLTWIVWMAVLQFADFDKLVSRSNVSLLSKLKLRK